MQHHGDSRRAAQGACSLYGAKRRKLPGAVTGQQSRQQPRRAHGYIAAVHCVPGEAGDGFDQHQVDLLLTASADHPLELRPLLGRGAGDTLVREDPRHRPLGVGHDLVGVVGLLGLEIGRAHV